MEIRHVPYCYNRNQLLSFKSTQLVLFDEIHVKKVSGPHTTSRVNDYNAFSPRNEEGKVDVGRGVYETNNQPKKATFKNKKEG